MVAGAATGLAETPCEQAQTYRPCELSFELTEAEAQQHPSPYLTVRLQVEFRSPEMKTYLMPGFWDGGRRLLVRFSPTRPGRWDYRITSNIARWDGQTGSFVAADSGLPGFVRVANVHHWAYDADPIRPKPHLWMGDTCYRFATLERSLFEQMATVRSQQHFTHLRGYLLGDDGPRPPAYRSPDEPDPAYFRELDSRIRFLNEKGITVDLILGGDNNQLAELFPTWEQRERYVRYVVARYAPMNVTWQLVQEFEEYQKPRSFLKELGTLLKKLDPYRHPCSTHTVATSAPLLGDGWMDYILYQSADVALGAIEHQLYAVPQVNAEFAYEDSGAGRSHPHHVDTDTFRRRLWNATMNGQYPTYGNTGTYLGRGKEFDPQHLTAAGAQQMSHWYEFFSKTRHWELEPYFDVDGGRALALTGVEYIVYVEQPGPVELITEKKTYQVYWFNPITGEYRKQKDFKGTRFIGEPPTRDHDWVLHLSRDEHKRGMLERWYFESRPVPIQEIEVNPKLIPYEIVQPQGPELSLSHAIPYEVKLARETRATRSMLYLWTAEVTASGEGYRVLASGARGEFRIPQALAPSLPATLNLRLLGMNALGKVYSLNRVYRLVP